MSLEAQGIALSYTPGRPVLSGASLSVLPGERVALEAPSGAGKTTLCRIIAGYLAPDAGEVRVDGGLLCDASGVVSAPRDRARPVQLVWQHPEQTFDPRLRLWRSLAEGVRAGCSGGPDGAVGSGCTVRHRHADEVWSALERAGIAEALELRRAWLPRMPHELSGGELMRLSIARALAARPRYLVADEVTASLDAVTQARVWRALIAATERDGMGIVLVSHSPALVRRVATRRVGLPPRP